MPRPQSKRNLYAIVEGVERKLEAYSGGKRKRLDAPKQVVYAGSNEAVQCHDPAHTVEPLTGRIVCDKDDPFIIGLHNLYEEHLRNPEGAQGFLLVAKDDDQNVLGTMIYTNAVLQSVSPPEGDRQNHDMVYIEFECQPQTAIVEE